MSRAKAAADRAVLDFYATPDALALAICKRLSAVVAEPRFLVEPSAGTGSFVRAVKATWPETWVEAVEVNPDHAGHLVAADADFVATDDWPKWADASVAGQRGSPDLILGNPPFRQAQEHIEAGLRWLGEGGRLAFLLRLNFLGSSSRVGFWGQPGLESVSVIAPRPSFGLNKKGKPGTDGTEYALFVWRKGYEGPPQLGAPIVWEKGIRTSTVSPCNDKEESHGREEEAA